MNGRSSLLLGLFALVGLIGAGLWYVAHTSDPANPPAVVASAPVALAAAESPRALPPQASAAATSAVTPEAVARWIAEATGGDAQKRAAAIVALADAPKSAAFPILHRILTQGDREVDRPLALRSLRDLALNQGDVDGTIRAAVREAIYHGDDEAVASQAQEALDMIEESELR
jgi:hypothetical protein